MNLRASMTAGVARQLAQPQELDLALAELARVTKRWRVGNGDRIFHLLVAKPDPSAA